MIYVGQNMYEYTNILLENASNPYFFVHTQKHKPEYPFIDENMPNISGITNVKIPNTNKIL